MAPARAETPRRGPPAAALGELPRREARAGGRVERAAATKGAGPPQRGASGRNVARVAATQGTSQLPCRASGRDAGRVRIGVKRGAATRGKWTNVARELRRPRATAAVLSIEVATPGVPLWRRRVQDRYARRAVGAALSARAATREGPLQWRHTRGLRRRMSRCNETKHWGCRRQASCCSGAAHGSWTQSELLPRRQAPGLRRQARRCRSAEHASFDDGCAAAAVLSTEAAAPSKQLRRHRARALRRHASDRDGA